MLKQHPIFAFIRCSCNVTWECYSVPMQFKRRSNEATRCCVALPSLDYIEGWGRRPEHLFAYVHQSSKRIQIRSLGAQMPLNNFFSPHFPCKLFPLTALFSTVAEIEGPNSLQASSVYSHTGLMQLGSLCSPKCLVRRPLRSKPPVSEAHPSLKYDL